MTKKCRVTLTLAEREELERLLARGKADVRKIKHAQILLKADEAESGPAWPDVRIAEAFAAGIRRALVCSSPEFSTQLYRELYNRLFISLLYNFLDLRVLSTSEPLFPTISAS